MKQVVKQRAFLFAITMLITLCYLPRYCLADEVFVELIWKFPNSTWLQIKITEGSYNLKYNNKIIKIDCFSDVKLGQSGLVSFVSINDKYSVLTNPRIELNTKKGVFGVREPGKKWLYYRGNLTITREEVNWKLTNIVDEEDYLKGVVPIEMSNQWAEKGLEALKAQAVAARTYMFKNRDSNGRITDSPNIHQAYLGKTVEGKASKAVEMTAGEILVDKNTGEPLSVFYSAHNGGYSEETQNVWENHDSHYSSQPDPFSVGIGGCVNSWRFLILAEKLGETFDLAPVRNIVLNKYSSGRVYNVQLIDWLGTVKNVSGNQFVKKFYPYGRKISCDSFLGTLFDVKFIPPNERKNDNLLLPLFKPEKLSVLNYPGPRIERIVSSAEEVQNKFSLYGTYVFNGRGWGHGVGMSQWGAYNMAMKGYSYRDILLYYYKNADIIKR